MRSLLCLGVVLALVTAVAADDKKEDKGDAKHMRGKIVRVNAEGNTITIRGDDNKEQELKVSETTKFWGNDRKPLAGGLKADTFKEGAEVWYRLGTGDQNLMVTELYFADPSKNGDKEKGGDKDK